MHFCLLIALRKHNNNKCSTAVLWKTWQTRSFVLLPWSFGKIVLVSCLCTYLSLSVLTILTAPVKYYKTIFFRKLSPNTTEYCLTLMGEGGVSSLTLNPFLAMNKEISFLVITRTNLEVVLFLVVSFGDYHHQLAL